MIKVNRIDGVLHPMEDFQLTVEISELQWAKAPEKIIYISKNNRWEYMFSFDHMDYNDGDIAGWWYVYKHPSNSREHKILLIND